MPEMDLPTIRRYTTREIAEAIMVYDELRRCGAVNKGALDLEKIASGYRSDWGKDLNLSHPVTATVEDLAKREVPDHA